MSEWPMVPLREVLSEDREVVQVQPGERYRTAGIYSYGRGLFWRPEISGAETSYKSYVRLRAKQFVFSKLFAWEGALTIVPDEFDGAMVSSEFPSYDVDTTQVDSVYLGYFVRREGFYRSLAINGMGDRRQRVNPAAMLNARMPLPSLPEQRRIAAWLGGIDELLAADLQLVVRASRLDSVARESLLSVSCVGEPKVRLGDALESIRKEIVVDLEKEYRTVGIKSFGKGLIRYPPTKGADLSKLRFYEFPTDSLAVSNIQAWEGALAMASSEDSERVASSRFFFYVQRPTGQIDPEFALAFLRTERGFALVKAASPGTTMRNKTLSLQRFEDILIPDPGYIIQRRTVKALQTLDRLQRQRNEQMIKKKSLLSAALNQVFGSLN